MKHNSTGWSAPFDHHKKMATMSKGESLMMERIRAKERARIAGGLIAYGDERPDLSKLPDRFKRRLGISK